MNEMEVEILEIDGKHYKRVKENGDEFWCVRTIALNCDVTFQSIYYHFSSKKGIFEPFIRSFKIILNDGKTREQLFLKVPEGLDQLRLYVRKLKNSPEMNKIMEFISKMRTGEIVAAKKQDVEKLQQQLSRPLIGQDLSHVIERLDRIETLLKQQNGLALPQKDLMDVPRKRIIAWLLDTAAKEWGVPGHEIWWDFSNTLGIDNYGKQPKAMFPEMLRFFYEQDQKLIVRAYNWYNSTPQPKQEIKNIMQMVFDPQQANLDDFSEDELSEYT